MALLFLLAVSGWALVFNAYISLIPQSSSSNGSSVELVARNYIGAEVQAEAGSKPYEQVKIYLTGQALSAETNIEAAKGAPQKGLALSGDITTDTLWRSGDNAMVEAQFTLTINGTKTLVGEHFMLHYSGGSWLISAFWRVVPDSGAPLLLGSAAAPSAASSTTTTNTSAPSASAAGVISSSVAPSVLASAKPS
jgi:hypothetical protein